MYRERELLDDRVAQQTVISYCIKNDSFVKKRSEKEKKFILFLFDLWMYIDSTVLSDVIMVCETA